MAADVESLDARAREVDRQLRAILADTPPGHTIRLPELGLTIEMVAAEGDTLRVGIDAPRDDVVTRPEAKPAEVPDDDVLILDDPDEPMPAVPTRTVTLNVRYVGPARPTPDDGLLIDD